MSPWNLRASAVVAHAFVTGAGTVEPQLRRPAKPTEQSVQAEGLVLAGSAPVTPFPLPAALVLEPLAA